MAVESEQVALILQLIILALAIYLLATHNYKGSEKFVPMAIESMEQPYTDPSSSRLSDLDYTRRQQMEYPGPNGVTPVQEESTANGVTPVPAKGYQIYPPPIYLEGFTSLTNKGYPAEATPSGYTALD
jgi:hypothetical protein